MRLILSGGGDSSKTKETDEEFVKLVGTRKILYIPIAKKTRSFEECYFWISKVFSDVGFVGEIVMWTDFKEKSLKDLNEFGGIFIGGGNTFSLLKDLKDSNFLELLKDYITKGIGVVYGTSAGAVIFGDDISIAKDAGDKNSVKLKDYNSMNLLDKYNIWPHYRIEQEKRVILNVKRGKPIIAIPEGSGMIINDKKRICIGKIYFFNV